MTVGEDVEQILRDIGSFLVSNLNNQIAVLNAKKSAEGVAEPVLNTVSNDAFFFQSLNEKVANYDPFIFYDVDLPNTTPITGATGTRAEVDVLAVVSDHGNDDDIGYRMLRYHRVLKDLFEKNATKVNNRIKLEVGDLSPVSLRIQNSSENYRAVGVTLTFDIG